MQRSTCKLRDVRITKDIYFQLLLSAEKTDSVNRGVTKMIFLIFDSDFDRCFFFNTPHLSVL